MRGKWIVGFAAVTAVAGLAGACSSSGGPSGSGGSSQPAGGSGSTISITLKNDRLTAPDGHTLYYNTVDTKTKISCTGACATEWPPLAGTPKAGKGIDEDDLTTITRPDGSTQVAYYGHPLYEFADDKAAGDAKGNGMSDEGGRWVAATPEQAASKSSAPMSSAGTGGY